MHDDAAAAAAGAPSPTGGKQRRGKGENHVAAVKMRELRGDGGEKSCEKATGGGEGGERDGGEAHNKPGNVKNLEHFGVSPPSLQAGRRQPASSTNATREGTEAAAAQRGGTGKTGGVLKLTSPPGFGAKVSLSTVYFSRFLFFCFPPSR